MKRVLMILLCICVLSVPVLAVEYSDFEVTTETGETYFDWDGYNAAVAAEKVAAAGLSLDVNSYWVSNWVGATYFDNDAFEADYAAALAALQEPEQSDGTDNAITDTSISNESTADVSSGDKYPLGSFIDEEGNVYSPEGELLSTGSETISYLDAIAPVLDEVEADSDETVVGDEVSESNVYNVIDMRSNSSALSVSEIDTTDTTTESDNTGILSDLKALIVSIFGEYTPVTTTSAITETVDGVTTTTLIDTVADGAAGVDYAWLAGVFLFGILLFCLMKLLGGILK